MKILLTGLAFSFGVGMTWMALRPGTFEGIIMTAPTKIETRWDTVYKTDTITKTDTVWDTANRSDLRVRIRELESEVRHRERELRDWNAAYQRLRRKDPNAASAFTQILINRK